MDNGLSSIVNSANSILVLLPEKPNFDTVAAGTALYLSLLNGKPGTSIACPSPMMVGFNRIIGVNKIASELGNKNLKIKFASYDANNIEKVSYDIINGEFNLTVVPKPGFPSPTKEQMEVGFSGVAADLVVLVGGAGDNDFPALSSNDLASAKIAHIGNRAFNSGREVMSFAQSGSTISEVVANAIKDNGFGGIDPDISTNLIMGVEEGTSNYGSNDVSANTFETVAYLLRNGGQRTPRIKMSPMGFPPGSIPNQPFNTPVNQMPQMPIRQVQQTVASVPQESAPQVSIPVQDLEGTDEYEQDINPPDDWLQPKVFKGSTQNQPQPSSFSENKG